MTASLLTPAGVLAGLLAERAVVGALTAWALNDFVISAGLAGAELRALAKAGGASSGAVLAMADHLHKWCGRMEREAHEMIKSKRPTLKGQDEVQGIIMKLQGWISDLEKSSQKVDIPTDVRQMFGLCSDHEHILMLLYSEPARHGGLRGIDELDCFIRQVDEVAKALAGRSGPAHPDHSGNPDFGRRMERCAEDLGDWARQARNDLHLMAGGLDGREINAAGQEAVEGIRTLIGFWLSWIVQHGPEQVEGVAA